MFGIVTLDEYYNTTGDNKLDDSTNQKANLHAILIDQVHSQTERAPATKELVYSLMYQACNIIAY